jgi:toxin ParE1/3/4
MRKWAGESSKSSNRDDGPLVRWSPEAAADFATIVEYIRRENPTAAERVARTIYEGVAAVASFPKQGRPGKTKGTRELVFTPLPYVAVYRLRDDTVDIVRILHGAQRWP